MIMDPLSHHNFIMNEKVNHSTLTSSYGGDYNIFMASTPTQNHTYETNLKYLRDEDETQPYSSGPI